MNLSDKSKQIIDACRFCWMCRHICPIGNATGQERNTSRARALALSMVNRGSAELTEDIMDNVYECACCSACTNDCATGWDPVEFTKEVRKQAVMEGKTPAYIMKMVQNCVQTGNIYGATEVDKELAKAIKAHEAKTSTLLYLGSDARFKAPKDAINAIQLLEKAGVSFTVLENEPDSGAAMEYMVSKVQETSQAMKKAAAAMNEFDLVVVYEPFDAKVIVREYQEWNVGLNTQVMTFPAYLRALLKEGKLSVKQTNEKITYQDSYILARELNDTENAREVLNACADLTEMMLNRKFTALAGHLLMSQYIPGVIALTAERRLEEAKATGATKVVVSSVAEKLAMTAAADSLQIVTLEELLLNSLA